MSFCRRSIHPPSRHPMPGPGRINSNHDYLCLTGYNSQQFIASVFAIAIDITPSPEYNASALAIIKTANQEKNMKKTAADKDRFLSPLGWSAGARLIWAAGAAMLIWLSVAWALGW